MLQQNATGPGWSASTCRTRRSPAFGGYKQSGFGRELSIDTLDLYLETQAVVQATGPRPSNPFGL
jgi:acyl-CoA reductase-like NAD-dependent aldehyde dehydrogenase